MSTLFKCPLPNTVPGVAELLINESTSTFQGHPVIVLGARNCTDHQHYRVYFDDFRDGILYASLIESVD